MKKKLKKFIKKYFWRLIGWRDVIRVLNKNIVILRNLSNYGSISDSTILEPPIYITDPSKFYASPNSKIRSGFLLINNTGKFIIKKYSAIACNCTIVTGNHRKTVSVPHILLGTYHINDTESDVIIDEDVWIGTNCTILSGVHIGRGAVVGACSLVNKDVPPYSVAVGSPAKIIASTYNIDQILKHEEALYPENERITREELENIFNEYFINKKAIGLDELSEKDKMFVSTNLKKIREAIESD